jgi:predicted  nucleic acid-binding Zn-ribbon protein
VDAWQCDVCGHVWYTKANEAPTACAKCKRRNWNQGVKQRIAREERVAAPKIQIDAVATKSCKATVSTPVSQIRQCSTCGAFSGFHQRWCKR